MKCQVRRTIRERPSRGYCYVLCTRSTVAATSLGKTCEDNAHDAGTSLPCIGVLQVVY